jgi:hypothetical protein
MQCFVQKRDIQHCVCGHIQCIYILLEILGIKNQEIILFAWILLLLRNRF